MRPFAHAEGHDLPWLVDEVVPGLAAQRDDVFVGFEDPVRQPVVAHELPDILHRVQLGRSWRQRQDGDVVGDRQLGRQVPTGLIDDQHRMGAGIDDCTREVTVSVPTRAPDAVWMADRALTFALAPKNSDARVEAGEALSAAVRDDTPEGNTVQSFAVTGAPTLALEIGTARRKAAYVGGSGSAVLTFEYTVQTV